MADVSTQSLVSTQWLADHLTDPDLRILDCSVTLVPAAGGVRLESGREAWQAGHIPGSGFADLLGALSAPDTPLPMMMPTPAQFSDAMGRLGVGPGTRVVLYDSAPHTWATRLWWMLRAVGFDDAAVLDGGLKKWVADGLPLSTAAPAWPPARFQAHARPGIFVDKATVAGLVGAPGVQLLNALSAEEHAGTVCRVARPGHIPGSANVPAGSLLDPGQGVYRPLEGLRDTLAAAGALKAGRVVAYCGGGIAATSVAFTLVRLGVGDVAVYDGSLAEWSRDPALPLQT